MAKAVTVILILINHLDSNERYSNFTEPNTEPPEFWSRVILSLGTSDISRFLNMPRARGKSRRGAAWYSFESRRQRQKKFKKALALASSRRNRKSGRPQTPPMAYVEEITLDEAMQSHPEHPLFTVPDNWNPHTDFGNEAKILATGIPRGHEATHPTEEFTTCYVEEEVSCCANAKADPPSGAPPEEVTQSNKWQAHQVSDANEGEGENYVQWPFPLASVEGNWKDQTPFTNLRYLALIFEMRSMVDDQIFRTIQINQRLDMLYVAHSRTLPRRQFPMCTQAYAIPAGWRKHKEEDEPTG